MKMLLNATDYYTQRNNEYEPYSACMNTTRAMLYSCLGLKIDTGGESLDDYIWKVLNSKEGIDYRDKNYPSMKNYPPNQIHGIYGSWLDEQLFGKRITRFRSNLSWDDIKAEIDKGYPVMTSGKFPGLNGHAFLICGYTPTDLVIADPWGNFHVGYKGQGGKSGYGILMNKDEFDTHVKPGRLKWGHVVQ